jgi:hypothetical protein
MFAKRCLNSTFFVAKTEFKPVQSDKKTGKMYFINMASKNKKIQLWSGMEN